MPRMPALPKKMKLKQQPKDVVKITKKQLSVQKRGKGISNKKNIRKIKLQESTVKISEKAESERHRPPSSENKNVKKKVTVKNGDTRRRGNNKAPSKKSYKQESDSLVKLPTAAPAVEFKSKGIQKSKPSSTTNSNSPPKWTIRIKPKGVSVKSKQIKKSNVMNPSRRKPFNKSCYLQPKVVLTRLPLESRGPALNQDDEQEKYGLIETLGLVKCVRKTEKNAEIHAAVERIVSKSNQFATTLIPISQINQGAANSYYKNTEFVDRDMTILTSTDNVSNTGLISSTKKAYYSKIVGVKDEVVYNPKLSIQSEKRRGSTPDLNIASAKPLIPTSSNSNTVCDSNLVKNSTKVNNLSGNQKLQITSKRKVGVTGSVHSYIIPERTQLATRESTRKLARTRRLKRQLSSSPVNIISTFGTETHLKGKKSNTKSDHMDKINASTHQITGDLIDHMLYDSNVETFDTTNIANVRQRKQMRTSDHSSSVYIFNSTDTEQKVSVDVANVDIQNLDGVMNIVNLKKKKSNQKINKPSSLNKRKLKDVGTSKSSDIKMQDTDEIIGRTLHDTNVEIVEEISNHNLSYIDCDNMSWCSVNKLSLYDKLQKMEAAVKSLQFAIEKLKTLQFKQTLKTLFENNTANCENYNLFEILEDIIKDSSPRKEGFSANSARFIIDLMIRYHIEQQKCTTKG